MTDSTFAPLRPLTETDAEQMRAHLERVQREETEWLEARLHHALHGFWVRDECATCQLDASIEAANAA